MHKNLKKHHLYFGMTPEKLVAAIINDVEALKNCTKLNTLRPWTSRIISFVKQLEGVDKDTAQNIIKLLENMFSLNQENIGDARVRADEALIELRKLQDKLQTPVKVTYLKVKDVRREESYIRACNVYNSYARQIAQLEEDLQESPVYQKKLHEPIKSGKYEKLLHARITGNLRLIYNFNWETGLLTFIDIITHDEFDKS